MMKNKLTRLVVVLTLVAALVAIAAGCGNSTPSNTTTKSAETDAPQTETPETKGTEQDTQGGGEAGGKKIAFTLPSLGNDFMVAVSGAMQAAVEEQGCTMQIDSADGDVTKQTDQVENYAQMGFDAIVVWPVNSEGLSNIVKRVEDQGVQVLGFTNVIEGATAAMVAADEKGMGEAEGELAGEWLDATFPDAKDGEIKVLFIQSTASPEAVARSEGLLTLKDKNKKINAIVEQVDWNDPIAARNIVENALLVNTDIKLICAINGTTGIAANSYVMSANSPVEDKSKFAIFCVDDTEEIDDAIKASARDEAVLRGTVSMGTIQDTVNDFMKAMQPFIDGGDIQNVYGSAFRITPETFEN